ncbi:IclR family transcriptional regulator [Mycobacterium kyogaense]|uniref:IclR family transcriptional regulator n=1 Tax=Mycobacterium kyogaense TaxID=2212479 RepID=UPI0013C4B933|nr:IclR family transcriptional regulator [Mycobacterium kyogaense]
MTTSAPATEQPLRTPPYDKSVLGKAHLLLGAFGPGTISLGLTELSQRSGVSKASTYRLAQELVHWGFLARRGDNYQLGVRIFEMSQRVPLTVALRQIARPLLTDLFSTVHTSVNISILDGSEHILCVEKIAGRGNVLGEFQVGSRLPTSCSSSGKVLLADWMAAHGGQLPQVPLPRLTARSVCTPAALHRQLRTVQARGFAVEVGEVRADCAGIAAPIVNYAGRAFAALSATVPINRVDPERLAPAVMSSAVAIGRLVDNWSMSHAPHALTDPDDMIVA